MHDQLHFVLGSIPHKSEEWRAMSDFANWAQFAVGILIHPQATHGSIVYDYASFWLGLHLRPAGGMD